MERHKSQEEVQPPDRQVEKEVTVSGTDFGASKSAGGKEDKPTIKLDSSPDLLQLTVESESIVVYSFDGKADHGRLERSIAPTQAIQNGQEATLVSQAPPVDDVKVKMPTANTSQIWLRVGGGEDPARVTMRYTKK